MPTIRLAEVRSKVTVGSPGQHESSRAGGGMSVAANRSGSPSGRNTQISRVASAARAAVCHVSRRTREVPGVAASTNWPPTRHVRTKVSISVSDAARRGHRPCRQWRGDRYCRRLSDTGWPAFCGTLGGDQFGNTIARARTSDVAGNCQAAVIGAAART